MSGEYLVAITSNHEIDLNDFVQGVLTQWPGTERHDPTGQLATTALVMLYLPIEHDLRRTEIVLQNPPQAIGIDSPHTEQVAEFLAWLARTLPDPTGEPLTLIEWADDLVTLTPDTTPETLLRIHH